MPANLSAPALWLNLCMARVAHSLVVCVFVRVHHSLSSRPAACIAIGVVTICFTCFGIFAARRNEVRWFVTYGVILGLGVVMALVGLGRGAELAGEARQVAMQVTPAQLVRHFDVKRTREQLADDLVFFYQAYVGGEGVERLESSEGVWVLLHPCPVALLPLSSPSPSLLPHNHALSHSLFRAALLPCQAFCLLCSCWMRWP